MTTEAAALNIAIVADTSEQQQRLSACAHELGLTISFCGSPIDVLVSSPLPDADCWLVQLEDENDHPADWDLVLAEGDVPVLFGLDSAPINDGMNYKRWQRKLATKLESLLGSLPPPQSVDDEQAAPLLTERLTQDLVPLLEQRIAEPDGAEQVWVLAASLGGPGAVKTFLDQLPPGLPVGFVYAQHIDDHFAEVLTKVLGRHAHYRLKKAQQGDRIGAGDVIMMPVDHEWQVDQDGFLEQLPGPWPGPYGPSIDQVLLNMSNYYRDKCHVIIFSGMGSDGAVAAPMLKAYGSRIWVQDSNSCGHASMPEAVAATGCVSFSGTPLQLAQKLVSTLEHSGRQCRGQQPGSTVGNS